MNSESGKCFYTDREMVAVAGKGKSPDSVSVDKVNPSRGYTVGNVVLCCNRINTIKQDVTPEELQAWMPGWHSGVATMLKVENW